MKRKIIINIDNDKISDFDAMIAVAEVMAQGKISETKYGKQYCFLTGFISGFKIYSKMLKSKTDTFRVW